MDSHYKSSQDPASSAQGEGRTVIAETAVAKVVGIAARNVPGVHALGSGASRSIGAIREVVGATDLTQGVRVEVGESQVAVDLVLMAEYGYPLQTLANSVRAAVYAAVEELVGRDVIEVNIEITDVFIPSADAEKPAPRSRLTDRLSSAKSAVTASAEATAPAEAPAPAAAQINTSREAEEQL